ncbi:MAG TPA: hypothetical protein VE912_13945, partial [Bacteroidales bacterium]|nr:hypothetical protein [Bacteroidales bacterium]
VTKGPDRVDFVLRDPPGSNSSSYVEKGFTLERTETKSRNKGFDASLGVFVAWGEENQAGPVSSHESTWENNNTFTQSISFNNGYSTSDNPAYTGDMGDVFFGTSTNITYGLCKMLGIFPVDSCNTDLPSMDSTYQGYKIGQMYNFAMGDEIATTFVYTQNHVENYLLPDLMRMRNNYFSTNPSVYALNDAPYKDKLVPSKGWYTYNGGQEIDSVEFYQAAINAWVSELAVNELQKLIADGDIRKSYSFSIDNEFWDMVSMQTVNFLGLQAFTITVGYGKSQVKTVVNRKLDRTQQYVNLQDSVNNSGVVSDISKIFDKNISFDAGASYEGSMTSSMETSVEHTYEFQTSHGFESEIKIGGFKILFVKIPGMIIEASAHYNWGGSNTGETGSTHESTVGYTLADEDQGDYYTVDIAKDEYGNGPVFIKRGGQTSCPYEDVTKTKYIKPGTDIGSSTMRIEVPTIQADQSVLTNVPEDMPAVFTVKLGNESEAEADNWYMLDVDAASNPDGAKITMDGSSLNSGTAIMIPANTQLTKHIEFRKGLQDVNDYSNIRLILHSMCQYDPTDDIADIADTVELSASFIPVCSKVNVISPDNNWLVNLASQDTLQVRISDYDLQSSTLQKIAFQYKAASDASWVTNTMMFKDTTGYSAFSGTKYLIGDNPYILHKMGMNNLSDRIYQIRAVSMCSDG